MGRRVEADRETDVHGQNNTDPAARPQKQHQGASKLNVESACAESLLDMLYL